VGAETGIDDGGTVTDGGLASLLLPAALSLLVAVLMLILMPGIARLLRLQRQNFMQEAVATGYGLAVWLPAAVALAWDATRGVPGAAPAVTAMLLFGLVGLVDDLWGDRSAGGFRGHLRQLVERGRLTTGGVKLAVGGGAALMLGLWLAGDTAPPLLRALLEPAAPSTASLPPVPDLAPRPPPAWIGLLDALSGAAVIALAANTLNLFDLRPLRTLKVFAGGSALLLAVTLLPAVADRWLHLSSALRDTGDRFPLGVRALLHFPLGLQSPGTATALLGPALVAIALYAPLEARRRGMLGDTGANALGALLGVVGCVVLPVAGLVTLALILAVLSLYAETHSLSALIRSHPLLDRCDRWGWRKGEE
jgi:UDP-GlcNAc:undecaprenyl-phosphate GlcNAc-1-phosphate transferase